MTTKKILIPLDGSLASQTVLANIQQLFSPAAYELILLRVADRPNGLTGQPPRPQSTNWPLPMYESAQDAAWARHPIYASQEWQSLDAALTDTLIPVMHELQKAGYRVSVAVRFGDPVTEIVQLAMTEGVDLVAMTSHSRTGLSRLVLGSVAAEVLHRLQLPVLLVRPVEQPVGTVEADAAVVEQV